MNNPITASLAKVTTLPASPVSDAPRKLMPRNQRDRHAVERERQHQRRAGGTSRNAREHEDAGADHGADTDHRDVELRQAARQLGAV